MSDTRTWEEWAWTFKPAPWRWLRGCAVSAACMRDVPGTPTAPCPTPGRRRSGPGRSSRHRAMDMDGDRGEHVVQRGRLAERTPALVEVRHELGPELLDIAGNGDRRRLAERAQALAVDPVADVEEEVELGLQRLARLEPAQDLRHPARPLPARRALAARLVLVELGDADAELHHAAAVVEHNHAGRSHRRVQLQQRVEVVADVDLIARQDHCRRAARNDRLELTAVRNAAAEAVDQLAHAGAVFDLVVPGVRDMS